MFGHIDEKVLIDIFKIAAPSYKEAKVAQHIKSVLLENKIDFTTDTKGNIYNISFDNAPILSAHMDTVQSEEDSKLAEFISIRTYDDGKRILKGLGVVGGDDKCGIYIMLELIIKYKTINFLFSVEEEVGGNGASFFVKENDLSKIPYALILDRRHGTDIICEKNSYGTEEFQKDLEEIGKDFKYSPSTGSFSDANFFKEKMSCANLSVGYHNPHSKHEYVDLADLLKALNYVEKVINTLTKKYKPKVDKYELTGYGYSKGWEDYYLNKEKVGYWKSHNTAGKKDWEKELDREFDFGTKEEKKSWKKDKKNKVEKNENSFGGFIGICKKCNKYTTIYKLLSVNTNLCSTCLNELVDEIDIIDQLRDPLNEGIINY